MGVYWGGYDYFSLTWGHPRWWFPWGYGPYWYGPYWYGSYDGYYGGYYDSTSVKFDVKPKNTSVFVDGYYAGIVADFGGWFQSLDVAPGAHVIALWNQGFKTVTQNVYVQRGQQLKMRYDMVQLTAGEPQEPRPLPPPPEPPTARGEGAQQPYPSEPPARPARPRRPLPPERRPVEPEQPAPPARVGQAPDYSRLTIRVQPAGAQVFIDGEAWQTSSDADRLVVNLPIGVHRVEVRKDGFKTFKTEVDVRAGESTTLNVSLSGQDGQ